MDKDAKKRQEKELRRKKRREMLRQAKPIQPKKKVNSWKTLLNDIVAETAELMGLYNQLQQFYANRMLFAKNQKELNPSIFSDTRMEEYEAFGKELDELGNTVRLLVSMSATMEDMGDTREKMEYLFDHMSDFNAGREQFTTVMARMQALDEKFVADTKELLRATQGKVDVAEELFPEDTTATAAETTIQTDAEVETASVQEEAPAEQAEVVADDNGTDVVTMSKHMA